MLIDGLILIATVVTAAILAMPRLANARLWRAAITPLASIIGSGFLVLGPVLQHNYGVWAPAVMLGLCLAAWLFGGAIRVNIAARSAGQRPRSAERLESLASWLLAFAYVISVAYYLNLFGAFAVSLTPWDGGTESRIVTSAVFGVILLTGWSRGFHALERMEQVSVAIKLAVIAGLLAALVVWFAGKATSGELVFHPPGLTGWPALTLAFGLIVTVQGFETTRYLGAEYDARTRIRAMILAQSVATAIYLIYIGLLNYSFAPLTNGLSETAIIDMMAAVAPILPALLVAAALAAQFSAAVADTGGAGGLVAELTGGKINTRQAYGVLVATGLALTWGSDIFSIIAYASRAFAAYYAVQSAIAAVSSTGLRRAGFNALAGLGAAMAILGTPVE